MNLKDKLTNDLKSSMQAGNTERTGVIRLLISSLTNERIKLGHELNDDETLKVLQRDAKQRRDSIDAYQSANRPELAAGEAAELAIIQAYLPQQLSEDELRAKIEAVVAELGTNAQMGQVVGRVVKEAGAAADGATVARLVRERLAA